MDGFFHYRQRQILIMGEHIATIRNGYTATRTDSLLRNNYCNDFNCLLLAMPIRLTASLLFNNSASDFFSLVRE